MRVKPTKQLSEAEGRAVLRAAFQSAGYKMIEDFPFDEDGVKVSLDGWDPETRIGYEYLTKEAHDRDEFRAQEIGKLVQRMTRGELQLLLVDGEGKPDAEMLRYLVKQFVDSLVLVEATNAGKLPRH